MNRLLHVVSAVISRFLVLKEWQKLLILSIFGLAFRLLVYALFADKIVAGSDTMQNIVLGRRLAAGDFGGMLDTYWSPLFPFLIGIVTCLLNDLVLPSVVISIIAGSLAVPLTYVLVRQSYGPKGASVAGVIAIFSPLLINSVFGLGTENIYLPLIIGSLIVGWNALSTGKIHQYCLTGIFLGFAYLTRPEAFFYPVFFITWSAAKAISDRKGIFRKVAASSFALVIGFALIATPYIFHLRAVTGTWTISGKTSANIASGIFSEKSTEFGHDQSRSEEPLPEPSIKELASNFIYNMRVAQNVLEEILPIFLLALVALGLFGERWDKERMFRESYLMTFCLLTIAGYAASWVLERYFYVLLPIFFGWIAIGIIRLETWFQATMANWKSIGFRSSCRTSSFIAITMILLYVYVFPVNFFVRSKESEWQRATYEERDAGIWLRKFGRAHPKIFSPSFRPAFYADGIQFWTTSEDTNEIIDEITNCRGEKLISSSQNIDNCKVDYVFISERWTSKRPYLSNLSNALKSRPEFELVYFNTERPGYTASIYQLK